MRIDLDVPAQMRDGVTLRANVYRPDGEGPWPTLLMRTPYGKDLPGITWCGVEPVQAARQGFMVVIQDTRGRFASDGEWQPFRAERLDGYDTVQWAARLPGSNGRVGMYGGSYCGNTQWLAAIERPPALAAISPLMTWSDATDGLVARGGAVELGVTAAWTLLRDFDSFGRLEIAEDELARRLDALMDAWDRMGTDGYWGLPVHDLAVLRRHAIPELGDVLPLTDPKIAEWCDVAGGQDRIEVPAFHIGGWYDIFLQGTLDNYRAMAARGRETRLLVGPWTHDEFADPIGDRLFGIRAARDGVPVHGGRDAIGSQLSWLGSHLRRGGDVEVPDPPVRIFVMGRNQWRDESAWPLTRARYVSWFAHTDGSLSTTPPAAEEQPSAFLYDPADPVPTVGGHTVMWRGYLPGPKDQAIVEARDDVLVFTSAPLQQDLEVTGRVRAVIHAESSAPSTDWVARLCDVHPDGISYNVCDGVVRVTNGAQERRRCEIDLWSTSNVFLKGHRLRLHVTSSSFPRWDRNLNTGHQRAARYDVARQRVWHDAENATYVELPVVG